MDNQGEKLILSALLRGNWLNNSFMQALAMALLSTLEELIDKNKKLWTQRTLSKPIELRVEQNSHIRRRRGRTSGPPEVAWKKCLGS